jgi:tetratricopeptide (TPR) repeat protein
MTRENAAAFAVAIAAFIVYAATLCPTIYAGDSGELAVAAATLGIAHPPGYPLWTLLGRLAVLFLPGTPAHSLNLFSALCAAAAAGFLAKLLTMLTARVFSSAGAALAFALARAVWSNSVVVEVYALNLLLTIAAITLAVAARRGRRSFFALSAYVLGLGIANHPFALLAGPIVLAAALVPDAMEWDVQRRARWILPMGVCLVLGISVYLYLPIRWSASPAMNWGGIRNLSEIWDHVTRSQYGGLGEASAKTSLGLRLRVFGLVLERSVPALFLVAGTVGLVHLLRRGLRKRAALLAAFFLVAGPLTAAMIRYEDTFLDRSVISVYFLPAVMASFLFAGTGFAAIEDWLAPRLRSPALRTAAGVLLAIAPPAFLLAKNFAACDRRDSTMARVYAENAIGPLPPNSRFYAMGDNECFVTYYFHAVEKLRPDVVFMDRTQNLLPEAYGEDFPKLSRLQRKNLYVVREAELAFAEKERPVFYSDMADVQEFGGCRIESNGIVYQLLRPGEAPSPVEHQPISAPPTDPDDYLETHLVASTLYREGSAFLREGRSEEARASFAESARRAGPLAAVHRNLGLAYLDLGDLDNAKAQFERALEIEPANEDALYNAAILYGILGQTEDSIRCFESLAQAGSKYAEVYLNYGVQLVRAGRLQDAHQAAEKALALEPDLEPAKNLEAAIHEGLTIGGEAGVLEAQRKIEPVTVGGTLQLAQRYLDRGDIERATDLYREAAKTAPADAEAAYGLGYGLLKIGRLDEAARIFRTVLELDPKSAVGRNALAFIFAESGESLGTAERLAVEALEIDPARSAYWKDTLGWVRYRRGKHDDALESLRNAQRELPLDDAATRAENEYHLGSVLASMGRKEEAKEALQKSLPRAKGERWEADARALGKRLGIEESS